MAEFIDLAPDHKEKLRKIAKIEELVELSQEEGFELTDEELDSISGGEEGIDTSGCMQFLGGPGDNNSTCKPPHLPI